MSGLPDDAIGYRLAAIVPCAYEVFNGPACENNKHGECAHYEDDVCQGDGTRVVITDIEVKPTWHRRMDDGQIRHTGWREVKP